MPLRNQNNAIFMDKFSRLAGIDPGSSAFLEKKNDLFDWIRSSGFQPSEIDIQNLHERGIDFNKEVGLVSGSPSGTPVPKIKPASGFVPGAPVPLPPPPPPKTYPDLTGPDSTDPSQVTRPGLLNPIAKPFDVKPYLAEQDKYFNDLLKTIKNPSSAETDYLSQALKAIDEGTTANVGSAKMDFLDRGLGGPGQISDIETSALNQARNLGAKNKAGVMTQFGLAKQNALDTAYTDRYNSTNDMYKSLLGVQGTQNTTLATLLAEMEKERLARAAGKYFQWKPNENEKDANFFTGGGLDAVGKTIDTAGQIGAFF